MTGNPNVAWTVVATTGEQFSEFGPYAAAVNDAGVVAFQAVLPDGGSGVFTGDGGTVVEVVSPTLLAGVTSHPDVTGTGAVSFYGVMLDGSQAVFLFHDGDLQSVADTRGSFALVGPTGPTMNEARAVAFRADPARGISGVFAADRSGVLAVADTEGGWSRFHGLPVIDEAGSVVFRADRAEGVEGIYAARGPDIRTVAETGEAFESLALFPSVGDDGTVAFAATIHGRGAAVVTVDDGHVEIVDTEGAFESFRGALIAGGRVVRIATPRGGKLGLYGGPDPAADRILAIGDRASGSTVVEFAANQVSINRAGQLAVRAILADGTQLILRADPGARAVQS